MSVIPYATFFIDYGLNMTATGHVDATIRISDVTQPLNFGFFNRVQKQLLMCLLVIETHGSSKAIVCGRHEKLYCNVSNI